MLNSLLTGTIPGTIGNSEVEDMQRHSLAGTLPETARKGLVLTILSSHRDAWWRMIPAKPGHVPAGMYQGDCW